MYSLAFRHSVPENAAGIGIHPIGARLRLATLSKERLALIVPVMRVPAEQPGTWIAPDAKNKWGVGSHRSGPASDIEQAEANDTSFVLASVASFRAIEKAAIVDLSRIRLSNPTNYTLVEISQL